MDLNLSFKCAMSAEGDFRDKGGACYDHAHIHLLATQAQPDAFVKAVAEDVVLMECEMTG